MLLSYHGGVGVIAELDTDTGALRLLPRPVGMPLGLTEGWFSIVQGACVAVFVGPDDRFRLRVGDHEAIVDESVQAEWCSREGESTLTVQMGGQDVRLSYPSAEPRSPNDLTPFVEEADDDFGLFLRDLLGDVDRMARVIARVKDVRRGRR